MPYSLPSSRSSRASHVTNYFIVLVTFVNCSCSLFTSSPSPIRYQIEKNERHEIKVGTALLAPAFDIFMCYRNDDLIGFDADVARYLVQRMSEEFTLHDPLRIRFSIYEWKDLFKAVQAGKVDFIIAGLSATPKRKEKYQLFFTHPYAEKMNHVLIFQDQAASKNKDSQGKPQEPMVPERKPKEDSKEPKFDDSTTFIAPRDTTQQDLAELLSRALGGRVALVETFADGVFALIGQPNHILVGDEGLNRRIKDRSGLSKFRIDEGWFRSKQKKQIKEDEKGHEIWNNDLVIAVAQREHLFGKTLNRIIDNEREHLEKLKDLWFSENPPHKCGAQQVDGFLYFEQDGKR